MSLKIIDRNLRTITTAANKVNVLIHDTAMLVANHAAEHGDCTRALALVKAMPASFRRTMLVAWFDKYTPIRVIEKNDKVGILKSTAKGYVPFNLEAAAADPWFAMAEATPEKQPLTFEQIVALVQKMGKRIEKDVSEGKVNEADAASALAVAEKLGALEFSKIVAKSDPNVGVASSDTIALVPVANSSDLTA